MYSGGGLTMSSVEIAERSGKRHPDVMRDIRNQLGELLGDEGLSRFASSYLAGNGKQEPCFNLPKRECLILVSGYSVGLRAAIVDRWIELENDARPTPTLPDFANPAAAARAWAEQFEARVLAEQTKAEIGSRREATAMNTASQAAKRASRLAIELDRSREYATVKRMQLLYHGQQFSWRVLKHVSVEMETPPIDVFDANYGTVKAYHADVWREAYALEIPLTDH
nr:Rha family transcriptional regulator [Methylobacterium thuringiense]